MRWGGSSPWGLLSPWGGVYEFCEIADDRVLVQMDDAPGNRKFRDLVCDFVEGLDVYAEEARLVGEAFDLDTATGVQLDAIGAVIGLPRQGFPDDRYRVFLKIQSDLLLSAARDGANWTGTVNNILTICRTFTGPGPAISLQNSPPYAFLLSIPGVAADELRILVRFICVAIYAGVYGQIIFIVAPDSLWDSSAVGPLPDAGIWCSTSVAVPNCATWGFTIQIGIDCE